MNIAHAIHCKKCLYKIMKNPRPLPVILDVTDQTLPEREFFCNFEDFWNLPLLIREKAEEFPDQERKIPGIPKFQKSSRSGRVW